MSVSGIASGNVSLYGEASETTSKAGSSTVNQPASNVYQEFSEDRVTIGASATDLDSASIDTLSLSNSSASSPHLAKLADIKARIEQGTYHVSSQDIADAMIRKGVFTTADAAKLQTEV